MKFSYSISLETLLVLLTNIIYQVSNKHDEDSHIMNFESWKTVFIAERLVQSEKILWIQHQIEEVKESIIKENVEIVMKTQQELKSFHWK